MFRVLRSLNGLKMSGGPPTRECSTLKTPYNPALAPVVKCHRKPRWIPTAKSKRFKVPKRPEIAEDERLEFLRLNNNYRTLMKSLRRYLTNKHCVMFRSSSDPEEILKRFKEDFQSCSKLNDEWNAEVKATREKRLQEEFEEELKFAREVVEADLLKQEELFEFTEGLVRREKQASASFITPNNIDDAIDRALLEAVDYNFALDKNGEKISGRETPPIQDSEPKKLGAKV